MSVTTIDRATVQTTTGQDARTVNVTAWLEYAASVRVVYSGYAPRHRAEGLAH
jgi:hypothetical protein